MNKIIICNGDEIVQTITPSEEHPVFIFLVGPDVVAYCDTTRGNISIAVPLSINALLRPAHRKLVRKAMRVGRRNK